jgi:hypothetical protein
VDDELDDAIPSSAGAAVIVELRQYVLVPGCRDVLVDLFDKHFVDGQEAVGINVFGQFLDLDDPNRFVWLRGFPSMAARSEGLRSFYAGPVWRTYRIQANATMVDSDNVLLLRPVECRPVECGAADVDVEGDSLVAVLVASLPHPPTPADLACARAVAKSFADAGARVLGVYATHAAENNFPALPVRDDPVLVWITRHSDAAEHARHLAAVTSEWLRPGSRSHAESSRAPQVLRLYPTRRSKLR